MGGSTSCGGDDGSAARAVDGGDGSSAPGHASDGGFFTGLVGEGLWGDVSGAADAVFRPVTNGRNLGNQVAQYAQGASNKWSQGDRAGAAGELIKGATGVGGVSAGLPGSGSRVGAAVQADQRDYVNARILRNGTAAGRKAWWGGLAQDQRDQYLALSPDQIGSLDGIPAATRDAADRKNLTQLIGKLSGGTTRSRRSSSPDCGRSSGS